MSEEKVSKEVFDMHREKVDDAIVKLTEVSEQLTSVIRTHEDIEPMMPSIRFWNGVYNMFTDSFKKVFAPLILIGLVVAIASGLGYSISEKVSVKKEAQKQEQSKNGN